MADKSDKGSKEFTARELEIMAKAWKCMIEEPKVLLPNLPPAPSQFLLFPHPTCLTPPSQLDYDMLAAECGMTNPRSAGNAWRAIRAKLAAHAGMSKDGNGESNGAEAGGNGSAKPTPSKKRAKAKTEKDDDESPSKKARGAAAGKGKKGKKGGAEAAVDGEVDGEEGGKVKTEAVDEAGLT